MNKHDTLLIACGARDDREILRHALQERYHLLEAGTTPQSLQLLRQNLNCIAAVVLTTTDPSRVDRQRLQTEENRELLHKVPIIVITKEEDPDFINDAFRMGAADVITLDYEPYAMLRRIENIVDLHLHEQYLEAMVREQATMLRHSNETMVDALSSIIEYRSVESGQHILRIRHFTRILLEEVARSCPEYALDDHTIAIISSASALHDIGKIAIPDSVLMKPGKLTPEEREIMQTHALTGCRILDSLSNMTDKEYLRYAHNICHYHHERWDGGGYPEGLSGENIPICAQVVGIADVYDALTSKRVYKDAYSIAQAVNMILKGDCGAFSPKLLECFKNVTGQFEQLARAYADGMSPKDAPFDATLPIPEPSPDMTENSLDRVRAKYTALVHHINGLLIEVNLNQDLFHVIYNPYPGLSWIENADTFSQLVTMLEARALDEACREAVAGLLRREVHTFMDENLRRSSHHLTFRSHSSPQGDRYEVTLLRINPIDAKRRSLAILCRLAERRETADQTIADSTCVCRNDRGFTLTRFGKNIPQLAGYTMEEIQARFGGKLSQLVIPEDREAMEEAIHSQLVRGNSAECQFRVRHKQGHIVWVLDRCLLTREEGEECLHCFFIDISHTRQEYDALNSKLQRYEIILAQTENVLFEWNMDEDRINVSDTWEKIFGTRFLEKSARSILEEGSIFHPDDLPGLLDKLGRLERSSHYEQVEVRFVTARGRYLWCRIRATAIRDNWGRLLKISGIIINIDAEKQAQRLLQDRAERDTLTRLLNKTAGRKQAEEYLARFPKGVECAMLIIDLDNFKQVNDRYGHLFGDAVLKKAAREIEKLFRSQDIVARIGGDEFMVLMRGISSRHLLETRCQRLLNIFANAFHSGRQKLPISCSIGIAMGPEQGTSYYELFNKADHALYRAKAKGKNDFAFYEASDDVLPSPKERHTAVGNQIDSDLEPGLAEDSIVRYAFQKLYASSDVDAAVNEILALMGKKMNVSRVYVFENSDDNRYCSNTYEWCNQGIPPEKDNLQNLSYETDIPDYESNFDEQGMFYVSNIEEQPQYIYDIVAPQGIQSMLHCAIREGSIFRGFIGFDECVEQRPWTREQFDVLRYFSEMLSVFLLKRRQQENALQQARQLYSILDGQNARIYIIHPDTYALKYCNEACLRQSPDIQPGMICHQAFFGKDTPCPGCPAGRQNAAAILKDEQYALEILAEATSIQWQGEDSCLMTCRKLPGR